MLTSSQNMRLYSYEQLKFFKNFGLQIFCTVAFIFHSANIVGALYLLGFPALEAELFILPTLADSQ